MATYTGTGFSQNPHTAHAARDAALQAKARVGSRPIDIVFVFASPGYHYLEMLRVIRQTLDDSKIVGCTSCALITNNTIEQKGISVLAVSSQEIKFGTSSVGVLTQSDMRVAGNIIARNAAADLNETRRSSFVIFYDGLVQNTSFFVKGIQEILGKIFPLAGAGASDNFLFKETFQFHNEQLLKDSAVGVLLGGNVKFACARHHGWKPLGKPRMVTRSQGALIQTIDGERASLVYEEYFGLALEDLRKEFPASFLSLYPLGIFMEDEKEYLLRHIIRVLEDGSLLCQGAVAENAQINFMITNKDFCKDATRKAAEEIKKTFAQEPIKILLVFSSVLRLKLLRHEARSEITIIQETLDTLAPIMGMYSYGELGNFESVRLAGETGIHNGTISILAIG